MKQKQLVSLLESKNIVVPLLFFKEYKKLNISLEEFMFLMYLKDKGNTFTFDPKSMSEELGISIKDILVLISSLTDKKLLMIDTYKNDKGIGEEKVDISLFYEKIASIISDEVMRLLKIMKMCLILVSFLLLKKSLVELLILVR